MQKTIMALACSVMSLSSYLQAQSLDEAVTQQLEQPPGALPCQRLLDAGANPTSGLLTLCARVVPAGSSPAASGGGSATTATTATNMLGDTASVNKEAMTSRLGEFSVFSTLEYGTLDRDDTGSEAAYDSNINRFVLGASKVLNNDVELGIAFELSEHDGDFTNGGRFTNETLGYRFLASFYPTEKFSLQLVAAYDDVDVESQRSIRFADVAPNNVEFNFSAGSPETDRSFDRTGFTARGSYEWLTGQFTLISEFGVDWMLEDYGTYSESRGSGFALTFHGDERESLQSTLGFTGTFAIGNAGNFVAIPQVSLLWRHEFEEDARDVEVSFVDDSNATRFTYQTDGFDSDFADLSLGSVFIFPNGVQAYVNVQTLLAHEFYSSVMASAGVRFEL